MVGSDEVDAGVRPGDILAGKYRVERVLGMGGMGVVVAAHHLQLDEKVALKFLLPEALGNPLAVARFAREARAAVKIKSEHVARVIDVGTLPNGAPYIVMEYLEGGDLSAWLAQRGPLPIELAVEFVLQACVALADAHALGIVHRDLKPANLFCVRRSDGQLSIKVLDFGISKLVESVAGPGMSMTKTAALMGSPLYMSPEQMRSSKDVDAQTDIWALGVILFELMTGRPAFVADSATALAIQVATEPPPSMQSFRHDVPMGLEGVILRCLEKDPRRRHRNVAELAFALLPFGPRRARALVERISGIVQAAGLSVGALAMPPSPLAEGTVASSGSSPPVSQTTPGVPGVATGKKAAAWALAIAGALGAAGAGVLLLRAGPHPPPNLKDGGLATYPPAVLDADMPLPDAGPPDVSCTTDDTRCSGSTSQTCKAGQWIDAPITAGQCGAVCTPASTPPQCSGNVPRACGATGQWEDRPACPYACNGGACVAAGEGFLTINSIPPSTCFLDGHALGATPRTNVSVTPGMHTVKFVESDSGKSKSISVSVRAGETKLAVAKFDEPPPPPRSDCETTFTLDSEGHKHFKPECYAPH
jgi:tRNA A-37 threonylcarbamoyl transferase component Bud32